MGHGGKKAGEAGEAGKRAANYRVEQKYIITEDRLALLRYRLEQAMELDPHAQGGVYTIRSLYFDDWLDSGFWANEAGEDFREKFRIRTYNNRREAIHLELKAKERGYTRKEKARLALSECMSLMEGRGLPFREQDAYLKKKLFALMKIRGLKPVQIVEYERTPFVDRRGNVRITLDRNLGGTGDVGSFLEPYLPVKPLLPLGRHILEVKYDEFLPGHLRRLLEGAGLARTAFSKYYYARIGGAYEI